jgi:hypothetical protein
VVTALSPFTRVVIDLLADARDSAASSGLRVGFRAEGLSMYPSIRHGETIIVGPVGEEAIVLGDVLLCRQGNRLLAHRVVAWRDLDGARMLDLRGDGKRDCDAPVPPSAVIGRVESVQRNGRTIRLCGRRARLRHYARLAASRMHTFVAARLRRNAQVVLGSA